MTNKISHLLEHKWKCQFWTLEDENGRIYGDLRYSLGRGLQVEAFGQIDPAVFERNSVIFGNSYEIGKFTLIGCISIGRSSSQEAFKIELNACYLVVGIHLSGEHFVASCDFSVSHLPDFCRTSMRHKEVTSFDYEILSGKFRGLDFKLRQFNVGQWVNRERISDDLIIYSEAGEGEALETLKMIDSKVAEILMGNDKVYPYTKKEVDFRVSLASGHSRYNIHESCRIVQNITDLLAVIMQRICIPVDLKISLINQSSEQHALVKVEYPVLISRYLSRREELQVRESNFTSFRDISAKDLANNIQQILGAWEELLASPLNLTLNVLKQYLRGDYNPAQHAVTCISALEQWYVNYEPSSKSDKKYDFMLEKYATSHMLVKLEEYVPIKRKKQSLGKILGVIRGQVLHPNSAREIEFKDGRSLDDLDLLNISEVLILVLLRALYIRFGIDRTVIDRYGGEREPTLREHFLIL